MTTLYDTSPVAPSTGEEQTDQQRPSLRRRLPAAEPASKGRGAQALLVLRHWVLPSREFGIAEVVIAGATCACAKDSQEQLSGSMSVNRKRRAKAP
jgi:hypothetical protein